MLHEILCGMTTMTHYAKIILLSSSQKHSGKPSLITSRKRACPQTRYILFTWSHSSLIGLTKKLMDLTNHIVILVWLFFLVFNNIS